MPSDALHACRPAFFQMLGPSPEIAVLRASRIGDAVCALPALHDLKQARPDCRLTLIALPMVHDLMSRAPFVDELVAFPGFPGIAEQYFTADAALSFFGRMQAERFDLVIQMHGTGIYSNPFALMLGGRLTAGFVLQDGRQGLLDLALPTDDSWSEVERCRRLISSLGAPRTQAAAYLRLTPNDHRAAHRLLSGRPRPWIGIHPRARDQHKVWPLGRYLQAADRLVEAYGGTVVLLGSEGDRPASSSPAEDLADGLAVRPVDLTGRLSLGHLAGVIDALDLFLGNDSGPAHLAYALDCPSVTVFGSTDPARWGPQNWPGSQPDRHAIVAVPMACRPCEAGHCRPPHPCLDELGVDAVAAASFSVLAAGLDISPKRTSPPSLAGSK